MGAGGARRDRNPPVRAEILHESERTRVKRLFLPGRTVVQKEPLGPDAERRLRHELAMLERLRGVPGVAQLVQAPRYRGSIVVEDVAGTSLAGQATPLAVDDLVALGLELARAVGGMHRRGVMHRDITPANIVISRGGTPCLVDFALATSLAEIRPEFTHHTEIVGTLAYLAPEQTGRTARPARLVAPASASMIDPASHGASTSCATPTTPRSRFSIASSCRSRGCASGPRGSLRMTVRPAPISRVTCVRSLV